VRRRDLVDGRLLSPAQRRRVARQSGIRRPARPRIPILRTSHNPDLPPPSLTTNSPPRLDIKGSHYGAFPFARSVGFYADGPARGRAEFDCPATDLLVTWQTADIRLLHYSHSGIGGWLRLRDHPIRPGCPVVLGSGSSCASRVNFSDVPPLPSAVRSKRTRTSGLLGHNEDHTAVAGSSALEILGSTSSGSRLSQGRVRGCRGCVSHFQTVRGGAGKFRALEPISIIPAAYALSDGAVPAHPHTTHPHLASP
jgi:hypothetical protein